MTITRSSSQPRIMHRLIDDIGKAMDVVRELFTADARILQDPAQGTRTESQGERAVVLVLRAFTRSGDI